MPSKKKYRCWEGKGEGGRKGQKGVDKGRQKKGDRLNWEKIKKIKTKTKTKHTHTHTKDHLIQETFSFCEKSFGQFFSFFVVGMNVGSSP